MKASGVTAELLSVREPRRLACDTTASNTAALLGLTVVTCQQQLSSPTWYLPSRPYILTRPRDSERGHLITHSWISIASRHLIAANSGKTEDGERRVGEMRDGNEDTN